MYSFENLKGNVQLSEVCVSLSKLQYSEISDVQIHGINYSDAPKFCDAYIASATYQGREMTEDELDLLNSDSDFVHNHVMKRIY